MDNKILRNATSVIWIAALIVSIILNAHSGYSYGMPAFVHAFATAILATIFLWWNIIISAIFGTRSTPKAQPSTNNIDSKAYKLAVLLEMMDEDEREEFKYQLKNDLLSSDDSRSIESFVSQKRKNK